MTDIASSNPYAPGTSTEGSPATGLDRLPATMLAILALVLIARGGFMAFMWGMQLLAGFDFSSSFHAAIFTKDSIYGASALFGGVLLLARHRIGWWFALVHWCWYLTCEVVVVAAAERLHWEIPVRHDPPALYRIMALTAVLGIAGLAILLWRPVSVACCVRLDRRGSLAMVTLATSVVIAFGVNSWMSAM